MKIPPPAMLHDGGWLTMIVLLQVLVHPPLFVTVKENIPAVSTRMHWVVAPVLHK
jgi:hypothetical protein